MPLLQDTIHRLEVGMGMRYLRIGLSCLAVVTLIVGYNWRSYRNFATPEAMDAAQVGRNLAEGRGYTTRFIRPFSLYLVKKRSEAKFGVIPQGVDADYAQIKSEHPDVANPPVYPCVLAALMKVLPFKWKVSTGFFWGSDGTFSRYEPDFLIGIFNQLLFWVVIVLTFLLARQLFDPGVAWLSTALLLGCELLWRFSVSGLSTMLLMVIFLGLVWCLVLIEREAREPKWQPRSLLLLTAAAGLLLGLGALTRYSFGWMVVPVVVFLVLFGGSRKAALCLLVLAVFGMVLIPWMYRNYQVSGTPFGTATFAFVEATSLFPKNKLTRALQPDLRVIFSPFRGRAIDIVLNNPYTLKLLNNSRETLYDLPRLGGTWLTPLFLAGLLLGFRSPAIRRLRYFLMMSLVMLIVVQAMGRTQLSEESPEVNTENLLVLLVPLIVVYGVSFFFLLLDQMKLLYRGMRYVVVGVFAILICLPIIFLFLVPKTRPVVYPPYYPPMIQQVSNWMKETELMMSDIPWAVAWYGNRQCIWTTLDAQEQFFAVNDLLKPVRALYLTPETMDNRFLTEWVRAGEHSWGSFILESMVRREIPASFPLRVAPKGFLPEQLFLTDWDRWKTEQTVPTPTSQAAPANKK